MLVVSGENSAFSPFASVEALGLDGTCDAFEENDFDIAGTGLVTARTGEFHEKITIIFKQGNRIYRTQLLI